MTTWSECGSIHTAHPPDPNPENEKGPGGHRGLVLKTNPLSNVKGSP